jgi:hypothetical protein
MILRRHAPIPDHYGRSASTRPGPADGHGDRDASPTDAFFGGFRGPCLETLWWRSMGRSLSKFLDMSALLSVFVLFSTRRPTGGRPGIKHRRQAWIIPASPRGTRRVCGGRGKPASPRCRARKGNHKAPYPDICARFLAPDPPCHRHPDRPPPARLTQRRHP